MPVYYSFTGKVVRDFGSLDRLWGTSITGIDSIRLGLTEDTEPDESLGAFDVRYAGRRNVTGVNWQRDLRNARRRTPRSDAFERHGGLHRQGSGA